MARAQRICEVCRKRFHAGLRRTTCSTECFLIRQAAKVETMNNRPKRKKRDPETQTQPSYVPTLEQIAHETALIRSGRLVVTPQGATYH